MELFTSYKSPSSDSSWSESLSDSGSDVADLNEIQVFHLDMELSNTRNEPDVIFESCLLGKKIFMWHPLGVEDEYLYFYTKVIEDFGVDIPFTILEPLILNIINIVPLQGACNIKAFI